MLLELEKELKYSKYDFLKLIVDNDNLNAIHFYNKYGFKTIENNSKTQIMSYKINKIMQVA